MHFSQGIITEWVHVSGLNIWVSCWVGFSSTAQVGQLIITPLCSCNSQLQTQASWIIGITQTAKQFQHPYVEDKSH